MTPPLLQGSFLLAVSPPIHRGLFVVVSLLIEAAVLGMLVYWGWAVARLVRKQPLLPRPPFVRLQPAVWGLGTVFTIICLYLVAGQAAGVVSRGMLGIRVDEALKAYRGEFAADAEVRSKPAPAPTPAAADETKDQEAEPTEAVAKSIDVHADENPRETAAAARDLMILNACHLLLFLAAFPWIFRVCSRTDLEALGLTSHRWPKQLLVGLVTTLIATPAVYVVQFLALRVFTPEAHPVEKMMKDQFSPSTALLAIVSAVILAPIAEEALFRGLLQGWLSRVFRNPFQPSVEPSGNDLNAVCWPAVAVTSALFAALHSPQWPAPIPLFFLAMILGVVYQRTGSLLTAITVHGLFNACGTLMMLAQQLAAVPRAAGDVAPAPAAVAVSWGLLGRLLEVLI